MSFGLLTAIEVSDVPRIMRRIADSYRGVETRRYKQAWEAAADLLDKYADEVEGVINDIKRSSPRERVRLDDDGAQRAHKRRRGRVRL